MVLAAVAVLVVGNSLIVAMTLFVYVTVELILIVYVVVIVANQTMNMYAVYQAVQGLVVEVIYQEIEHVILLFIAR